MIFRFAGVRLSVSIRTEGSSEKDAMKARRSIIVLIIPSLANFVASAEVGVSVPPPDYDHQPHARFPVLYLLPGHGEDELCWFSQGHANVILDNLIAEKKAAPMLVVTCDPFRALKPGEAPLVIGERRPGQGQRLNFGTYGQTLNQASAYSPAAKPVLWPVFRWAACRHS